MRKENMLKFMSPKTYKEFEREYSHWIIKGEEHPDSYDMPLINTHLMDFMREHFIDRGNLILAECEEPEEGKRSRKKFYHLSIEEYENISHKI